MDNQKMIIISTDEITYGCYAVGGGGVLFSRVLK